MKCLKCGRELETEQVFCNDCLLEMDKYPIAPNAVVQLPMRQPAPAVRKTTYRRTVSPEEQIHILKKRVWLLSGILIVTLAMMIAMAYPTVNFFIRKYHLRPGQNYTAIVATTEAATETTTETTDPYEGLAE